MSLSAFLKENKKKKENVKYAATKSVLDASGAPMQWEIRAVTTRENDEIRESCMREMPTIGKKGAMKTTFDIAKYNAKLVCAAVVYPNLNDASLQNSYGVMAAEDLLREIVDSPGEYQDLLLFVQSFCGFDTSMDDEVEAAKN